MKRFLLFGLDTTLSALFGLAVIAMAARTMPAETVGSLAFVIALVTLQIPIATMGIDKLIYARLSRSQQLPLSVIRHQLVVVLLSGLALYLITIAIAMLVGSYTFCLAYAMAGIRIVFAYSEIIRSGFRARRQPEAYTLLRLSSSGGASILLALSLFLSPSLHLLALIWALEWVLFALILTVRYRSILVPSLRPKIIRVSLGKSWPTMVQMASVGLYFRFDQIYIGWRLPPEHLGIYAIGARMAEAGNMFFGLLGFVITPLVVKGFCKPEFSIELRRSALALLGASVIFLALSWMMGAQVITFLFGAGYVESGHIFMIYVLATPFTVLGFTGSAVVLACGAHYAPMVSGLASGFVCIVLTIFLVEWFGSRGAAVATVLSYAVAAATVWIVAFQCRRASLRCRSQSL